MYVTYTRIYGWSDYGGESSYQPGYRLENMMWMTLLVYDYIIPGEYKMGRSNWKTKLVVGVAFILSIIAGVLAAMFAPDVWKGLVGFGTFAIVLLVLVFIFIKVLHIGGTR